MLDLKGSKNKIYSERFQLNHLRNLKSIYDIISVIGVVGGII
jgi:hypothetical protein